MVAATCFVVSGPKRRSESPGHDAGILPTSPVLNLISRRDETAAIRSQANTAKLLADNPTLMRLRELEVLEKVAAGGQLKVVLGEKGSGGSGLADRVVNLL